MNPSMPYRFDSKGTTYIFNATLIREQDHLNPRTGEVEPWTEAMGWAWPDYDFSYKQTLRVWHMDNPGVTIDLTMGIGPISEQDREGIFYGKGSMLMLGELRHYLVKEE